MNSIIKTIFLATILLIVDTTQATGHKYQRSQEDFEKVAETVASLSRRQESKSLRSLYRRLSRIIAEENLLHDKAEKTAAELRLVKAVIVAQAHADQDTSTLKIAKQQLKIRKEVEEIRADKATESIEKMTGYIHLARQTRGLPFIQYYDDEHVREEASREL